MSKALEAAARAASETWCRFNHGEPYTGEAEAIARAVILAFLREADATELGAAVRDADNPTHAAIARAVVKALTRLAEETTP